MAPLPPFVTRDEVLERLRIIFPVGTPNRLYCVRELAANTVFTALYIGAVEGSGRYLAPVHVYRMTAKQAAKVNRTDRENYAQGIIKKSFRVPGTRWYADNSREAIRDETLRDGFVAVGAVLRREDLPTTSGAPRYALRSEFAALFDPSLEGPRLEAAITAFQTKHLSKSALARTSIMRSGAIATEAGVLVKFPNGETRKLAPGPSSVISKAVGQVANAIGLKIEPDKNLPDLILADLGPIEPLIVFVEVVATDGAITARRQEAIYSITDPAGFHRSQIVFLTAYLDRDSAGFRKTIAGLAWNSFVWFVSEPENIVVFRDGGISPARLSELVGSHRTPSSQ